MKTANTTNINRIRISQRWAWVGPAAGIAVMAILAVVGIVNNTPGLVVVASTVGAALGGVWAAVDTSLKQKIAQAEG